MAIKNCIFGLKRINSQHVEILSNFKYEIFKKKKRKNLFLKNERGNLRCNCGENY